MKKLYKWTIGGFILLSLSICSFADEKPHFKEINDIQFYFSDSALNSLYKDENGYWRGKKGAGKRSFQLEIARAVMKEVGYTRKVELMPFRRALVCIRNSRS